jgi:hypothetical protein
MAVIVKMAGGHASAWPRMSLATTHMAGSRGPLSSDCLIPNGQSELGGPVAYNLEVAREAGPSRSPKNPCGVSAP